MLIFQQKSVLQDELSSMKLESENSRLQAVENEDRQNSYMRTQKTIKTHESDKEMLIV